MKNIALAICLLIANLSFAQSREAGTTQDTGFVRILANGKTVALSATQLSALVGGGGGGLVDADYGDVTVSGGGTVMTIDNTAVTNAKILSLDAGKLTSGTMPANFAFTSGLNSTLNLRYNNGNPAVLISDLTSETSIFSKDGAKYVSANNTEVLFGAGGTQMAYNGGELRWYDSDITNYVGFKPPATASLTANYTLTLPVDDGLPGQVWSTDGTGIMSWVTPVGGTNVISPALLTADQNDYAPTGIAAATDIRLSGDANFREISGLTTGAFGRAIKIRIVGSFPVVFLARSTLSSAANRFNMQKSVVAYPGTTVSFAYDNTDLNWVLDANTDPVMSSRTNIYTWNGGSSATADQPVYGFAASGAGAALVSNPAAALTPTGHWRISTGTTATGTANVFFPKTSNAFMYFSTGYVHNTSIIQVGTLSTATDRFVVDVKCGSTPQTPSTGTNNSYGFTYTDNVNGGRWQCYTRSGAGVTTTIDSGVTTTSTPTNLTTEVNYLGTKVRFYINGVYVGQSATNMPSATGMGGSVNIIKSVGTGLGLVAVLGWRTEHHF